MVIFDAIVSCGCLMDWSVCNVLLPYVNSDRKNIFQYNAVNYNSILQHIKSFGLYDLLLLK